MDKELVMDVELVMDKELVRDVESAVEEEGKACFLVWIRRLALDYCHLEHSVV